jgi:hypothetical protein
MATLMLVNPRKRRSSGKKRASPARKTRSRKARRTNPVSVASVKRRARRNIGGARRSARRTVRRHRNPISMGSLSSSRLMKMLTNAALGGAGSIGVDLIMGQVRKYLPPSLQPSATGPGVYDAIKVALTIALGRGLSKMTKGASEQMAAGALTVQAAKLMEPFVAQTMPQAAAVAGLRGARGIGYMVPTAVAAGNSRLSPMSRGMAQFIPGRARSPLLAGAGVGQFVPGRQRSPALSRGSQR